MMNQDKDNKELNSSSSSSLLSRVIILQRDQEKTVEMQEKIKWIKYILKRIGVPGVDTWHEQLSMDDLRRIRVQLKKIGIDIIDLNGGYGIGIYVNGDMKAKWEKPTYVLRKDPNELDKRRQFYLEMHLNTKDVFEKK